MKKSILTFSATMLTIAFAVISCSSPAEKVEKAENHVVEANNKLDSAIKNYQEDMAAYRIETANRIVANEKIIADFNLKIAKEKNEKRKEYLEDIAALNKKNIDMKIPKWKSSLYFLEKRDGHHREPPHDLHDILMIQNNRKQ